MPLLPVPPFPLVFASSLLMPSPGLWLAILYVILLARSKGALARQVDVVDDRLDVSVSEVRVWFFGEAIVWRFNDLLSVRDSDSGVDE